MKLGSKFKWSLLAVLAALTATIAACGGDKDAPTGAQRVKHVFVITLENKDYADTFGTSTQDPYLQKTLPAMGALLTQYYGTGHASLTNYVAMISGQPVTPQTAADCTTYADFAQTGTSADGLPVGTGCVYPSTVRTLPNQLKAAGLTWRGYMEDMGNDPTRESATCGHPVIGTADQTNHQLAPSAAVPKGDQYAARHNPFVYFHSIIDTPDCQTNVVALDKLETDLAKVETTPNFVFITPNVCNDGHDGDGTGAAGKGCINGQPGGLKSADEFLKVWVPKILASEAYKKDGLLIINFDEGGAVASQTVTVDATGKQHVTVSYASSESCCNQVGGPNVSYPLSLTFPVSATMQYDLNFPAPGGGRTGAVLLSPFIKPGTVSNVGYNHYSLLKSVENIFGIKEYLGYANQAGLAAFGDDVFTN
ncbi:alkaline phosphatase family protein [Massilia cellulosiltytica]|uniref:alkaline phosphatase family protein n=1 Tax=Massilia cellulosiltytica TaxID=2683234 RepID=UPI0039B40E4E